MKTVLLALIMVGAITGCNEVQRFETIQGQYITTTNVPDIHQPGDTVTLEVIEYEMVDGSIEHEINVHGKQYIEYAKDSTYHMFNGVRVQFNYYKAIMH